jgi:hypothetical protein
MAACYVPFTFQAERPRRVPMRHGFALIVKGPMASNRRSIGLGVRWHKADMLKALTNVRFWGGKRT